MEREERNRRISELREPDPYNADIDNIKAWRSTYIGYQAQPFGVKRGWRFDPLDWHADANWPQLLREMHSDGVNFNWVGQSLGFWKYGLLYKTPAGLIYDIADAVCEAWLRWKQVTEVRTREPGAEG